MIEPPMHLKCPYCRRWFKIKEGDLEECVKNINKHIGHAHADAWKIKIVRLNQSLLAYIKKD